MNSYQVTIVFPNGGTMICGTVAASVSDALRGLSILSAANRGAVVDDIMLITPRSER